MSEFRFKQFTVQQDQCTMKVGTDGVLLGAWANSLVEPSRILDIGTGTGLLALMAAQRFPAAHIDAVEIDESAARQATQNVADSAFAARIQVVEQAIQDFAADREHWEKYDLIISNPPFFTGGVLSENQTRNMVRHTVKLSHQDLLSAVRKLLHPQGSFCLILPWIEGLRFRELAQASQLHTQSLVKVSSRPTQPPHRLLLQLGRTPVPLTEGSLCIHDDDKSDARSTAYDALTKDFYL